MLFCITYSVAPPKYSVCASCYPLSAKDLGHCHSTPKPSSSYLYNRDKRSCLLLLSLSFLVSSSLSPYNVLSSPYGSFIYLSHSVLFNFLIVSITIFVRFVHQAMIWNSYICLQESSILIRNNITSIKHGQYLLKSFFKRAYFRGFSKLFLII